MDASPPPPPGIVLFAHGARDARWAAPFEAVAARVRAARPDVRVVLAYLELMQPGLGDAAAALVAGGCTQIDVLPLFLGAGAHLKRDLPQLLQQLQAQHPGVRFTLHRAVGEDAGVIAAMADAALAVVPHR